MVTTSRVKIGAAVLAVLAVLGLIALLVWPRGNSDSDNLATAPASSTPSSAPAESTETTTSTSSMKVKPSAGREIVIDKVNLRATVDDGACAMVDGALNPPLMDTACFYTAPDKPYSLPSSEQPDLAVLAGHAGALVPAVFDPLYDMTTFEQYLQVGDELKVRTEESGDKWLVYRATDFHTPMKDELPYMDEVWGADATPGRLVLVTCLQPEDRNQASVRNVVIGFQFDRVE
ncbi:class F sortase [Corynebacterium ulceribovis]|uniref:class F sortase n=1 Tax=Corynebacterium ulceribovis TaxID=487732 RepID=UPI00037D554C|nr:class F sortase [Corynebacterium ulceribovis]